MSKYYLDKRQLIGIFFNGVPIYSSYHEKPKEYIDSFEEACYRCDELNLALKDTNDKYFICEVEETLNNEVRDNGIIK